MTPQRPDRSSWWLVVAGILAILACKAALAAQGFA